MFEKKYLEEVLSNLKLINEDYEYSPLLENIIELLEEFIKENY